MPDRPTLSLCLIAKNEERHLARCLGSARDLVDEIVLVDTGSTDRTVEIAASFGARVFHLAWQDDFSLARNYGLEQARGEWILALDADESIAARDHAQIRAVLGNPALNAVTAYQRHYLAEGTVIGWQPGPGGYEEGRPYPGFFDVECRRLFRNRPWLRFRNSVHEELVSTDPGHPLAQTQGGWIIHHYGKVGGRDLLRTKGEAYLRIGRKKVADHPNDPLARYELGIQYLELEQPGDALACFERVQRLAPNFRDTPLRIAICHIRMRQLPKALTALRLAAVALPQFAAEVALEEGNAHRALGDLPSAERAFRRAMAANPGFAAAAVNLALLFRADRPDEALACLDASLEHCPGHFESLALRAQIRRDHGDDAGALRDLEALGSHSGALRLRARILAGQGRYEEARTCLTDMGLAGDAEYASLQGAVALGLGDSETAIDHLRESLARHETLEAAMNLSTALEARGDPAGATQAAAQALRLAPDDGAALVRFSQLASPLLGRRKEDRDPDTLTLFFAQPYSLAFDGTTPRERGLGGTESAIVYLAEALARRGHRIVVFNGCETARIVEGVEYARWETLPERCLADRPDVLVAVRFWQTIGAARLAPVQIFWTGDAFDQPFLDELAAPRRRAAIDLFMLQSDWQAATFEAHHQVPAWRIVRTGLGTAASAMADPARPTDAAPRQRRLAYASTPFRGLDVLLDLFPRIRAACPDARLDVFSSMRVYGMAEADDRKQFRKLYRKAKQPGVTLVGSLPQPRLAVRLQEARVLAYPNHYPETFCIAAMEAQAAGCAVVTSALGALPETVGDAGICIPGDPHSAAYGEAFVQACLRLLKDDDVWLAASRRALTRAWEGYTWPAIAAGWEGLCRAALVGDGLVISRIATHLAADRAGLAVKILQREACPAGTPPEAWDALRALAAWRAGEGARPSSASLRAVALAFTPIRRLGLLERWAPAPVGAAA
ncbi:MAG TPA: glycosyltransferase [Vicinamibacterales bacterium]|nr:glycosyltransferase [Vicinamibacterales bacterium]